MTERNALAELAERLGRVIVPHPKTRVYSDLLKAYRIVAELSKVQFTKDGDAISCYEANVIVNRCLAIAKEGANNGK